MTTPVTGKQAHVVIIGGGFGGLKAARTLAKADVRITLVDRTNHHLFQPLLYQVAMAGLSPSEIASPLRSILRNQRNVQVLLDEVEAIDLANRQITMRNNNLNYDYLIIATGAQTSYFGRDDWAKYAIGLKDVDDAIEIRRRVLLAFEAAEREKDEKRREQMMTFVIIGGGPTGVELAGTLSELARFVLARDFRNIDPESAKVILLERGPHILTTFPEDLRQKAAAQLKHLGVEVRTGLAVSNINENGVYLGDQFIPSNTVLWGAGVAATPLTRSLGVELDRVGRVKVEADLSVPGNRNVFVIGDAALFTHQDGKPLPGVAPVAMQQGIAAAKSIIKDLKQQSRDPFHYVDKGNLATIGRSAAVADFGKIHLSGFPAWVIWLAVHIFFLIGFHNRLNVFIEWTWSYITYNRGARLISGHRLDAGPLISSKSLTSNTMIDKPVAEQQPIKNVKNVA